MAKYKIVEMPKFPGGGEVELDGYRYKQDPSGKWFFTSGAPVTDPMILQRLPYEAKPVGAPAPSPYAKPDIRTGNMKVTAASRVAPYRENAVVLQNALAQKQAEDQRALYEKQRAAKEKVKLDQEQAYALANPNAVLSETLGNVAAKTTPQTNEQWQNFEGAKQEYYDKRNFLADNALNENYDAIAYEVASDIQKKNPKLTFEEALAKAKEDTEALKKKAINTYVTQDPDVLDRVATERGFYAKQKAGNTTMQQLNPNDPNHISFADPGTVEGYLTRAKDAVLNPLDATQYFMTGEDMPYNYAEYEKMKQATGYQDAADQNAVLGAVDFASWFHPVGLYGQGMKMIEPTAESIGKVVENPTWENVGTAAWDTGMAALTFAGSKSPLKFMAEEAQATRNAEAWGNFMRKPTGPNPTNSGTGLLPVASLEAAPSVLPSVPVTDIAAFTEAVPSSTSKVVKSNSVKNLKKMDARKQFLADLQNDPEYQGFKENAIIRDEEGKAYSSFGVPNSITKDQFKNVGNTYDNIYGMASDSNFATPSKFSSADNKIVADKINDAVDKKLLLWQTPEGINRLQQLIDNTPALAGETPQSFLEGLSDLTNYNANYQTLIADKQVIEDNLNQLEILYNEGKLSAADYKEQIEPLEKNLDAHNKAIANGKKGINEYSASYNVTKNGISVRPGTFKPEELGKVIEHELGHFPGGYATKGLTPTYLDDELSNLDLITDTSTQLSLPLFNETSGNSAHYIFGKDNPDYLNESLRYFKEGTNGTEKVPYLAEVREDMLEKEIIKSEYDKITPKMLKDHFKDYKNTQGEKYPLRLYDIIKDKPENFNTLSKVLDKLPMVMQAVGLADAFFGDEDVDTKEAGFSLMLGALSKGKGRAVKAGKALKKFTGDLKSAVLYEDKAIDKLHKLKLGEYAKNYQDWNKFHIDEFTPKKQLLEEEINKYKTKIKNSSIDPKLDPIKLHETEQKLSSLENELELLINHDNTLKATTNSPLGYVTDIGQKPIVSFKTGQPVSAMVELPGKSITYSIDQGKLNKLKNESSNPIVSKEYINVLQDNIDHIESITGAKVFGSAVGVTKGGLPHLTGDIDALILDTDYNKNVKNKLKSVGQKGPAQTHNIGVNNEQGDIDFNIIHTNSDGTVKVHWTTDAMGEQPRSLELELLRQFFPDKFYELQKEIIKKSGKTVSDYIPGGVLGISITKDQAHIDPRKLGFKIDIPAKEFMDKIDPAVKTIVDAYESDKIKHMNRIDSYINYGNTELVHKGQETYVKSLVGSKGNLGPQLSNEALSNVEQNIEALRKIRFIGDIEHVAKDPKRMQLALNDYYINNSITNRMVEKHASLKTIEKSLKNWDPSKGGGSGAGWGLNTVLLGDPAHYRGTIMGQMQYKLNIDSSSPIAYVDSIEHAMGNKTFTPEEKNEIYNIINKHSNTEYSDHVIDKIKETFHLLSLPEINGSQKPIQKIFNDITKQLGIRATGFPGGLYGKSSYRSILGDFDDATDALQYAILSTALKPKSLVQRQNQFKYSGVDLDKTFNEGLIESVEDYKKLENYINGGLEKAKARQKANMDFITFIVDNLKVKAEAYAKTKNPELAKEIDEMQEKLKEYEENNKKLREETKEYADRAGKIRDFRKLILPVLLSSGVVGTVGTIMHASMTNPSASERHKDKSKETTLDFIIQTDRLSKKESKVITDYFNTKNTLKGFTWPNGEKLMLVNNVGDGFFGDARPQVLRPKKKFKEGGSVQLDLTPEEIQEYIKMGYVVEEH